MLEFAVRTLGYCWREGLSWNDKPFGSGDAGFFLPSVEALTTPHGQTQHRSFMSTYMQPAPRADAEVSGAVAEQDLTNIREKEEPQPPAAVNL